jgi:membrane protease YdiL (CAAX protease family)
VVAILEELVFRGALFGLLRQSMPWPAALVVSSAIYSAVHFIQKGETALPVRWDSGLALLWEMLRHPPPLVPAFFTLFVAGSILALCYQRTGALYFSIGLHAGWIFWLKAYGFLSHPSGAHSSFWGADNLIDGWLSCIVLVILLVLIGRQKQNSLSV